MLQFSTIATMPPQKYFTPLAKDFFLIKQIQGCEVPSEGCISLPGDLLRPQGASPRLLPTSRVLGSSPGAWGAPNKGNADGTVGILWNVRCVWAPTLPRTHQKKALCHTCLLGGASNKYRRSISVLFEQYEISYLFYVTLSFLCNIICYLISVFVFSLVTVFGATAIR